MAFENVKEQKDKQATARREQRRGPEPGGGAEAVSVTNKRIAESKRGKEQTKVTKDAIKKAQALSALVDNPYDIRIPSGRIPRGIPYAVPINFSLDVFAPNRQKRLNKMVKYFDELENIEDRGYTKDAEGYNKYMKDRMAGIIDASGNLLDSRGDIPLIYDDYMDAQIMRKTPQGIMTQNIMEEEKSPTPQDFTQRIIYDAYGAKDGGRAEYRVGGVSGREYNQQPKQQKTLAPTGGGGTDALQTSFVPPPASGGGSGIASINKTSLAPETNRQDMKRNIFKSILAFAGNRALNSMGVPTQDLQKLIAIKGLYDQTKDLYGMAAPNMYQDETLIPGLGQMPEDELPTRMDSPDDITDSFEVADLTNLQKKMLDKRKPMIDAIGIEGVHDSIKQFDDDNNPSTLEDVKQYYQMAANGGRIGAAFGGIMDTATGRKAYGLGSLFKSIKKATKKVLGSDLGKIALTALGGYYLGGGQKLGGAKFFENRFGDEFDFKNLLKRKGFKQLLSKDSEGEEFDPFKGIMTISAVPFAAKALNIGQPKEETLGGGGGGGRLIDPLTQQEVTPAQLRSNLSMAIEDAGDDPVKIAAINEAYPFLNLGDYLPYPTYGVKDGGRIGFSEGGWEAEWDEIYEDYKLKQIELGKEYVSKEEFIDMHRDNNAQGGRIGAQEGGLMDLGGMEKDYRNEGGFVAIGGEERADDVPARLSRNEFVFTADAVRGAGGGDIDKGAEIMENVMQNLEQGGKMSEESQGNAGAQEMFSVSERIGEVF